MISYGHGKIYLDTIMPDELEQCRIWRNMPQIWASCRQNDLISIPDQQTWYQHVSADPETKMYAVRYDEGQKRNPIVGVAGLTSINKSHGRAEFSLYIAPGYQKRGFGRDALKTLVDHGFKNMRLNCIYADTFDGNDHALKLFKECGFRVDGRREQFYWKDGKFIGCTYVSVRKDEWTRPPQLSLAG